MGCTFVLPNAFFQKAIVFFVSFRFLRVRFAPTEFFVLWKLPCPCMMGYAKFAIHGDLEFGTFSDGVQGSCVCEIPRIMVVELSSKFFLRHQPIRIRWQSQCLFLDVEFQKRNIV